MEDRVEHHTGYLLIRLGNTAAARFEEALAPTGLRSKHIRVLEYAQREALSQQELCERTGLDRTTMVGLVDELEERGFVRRERRTTDRRKHVIVPTQAGAAAFGEATEVLAVVEQKFLSALSAAERGELGRLARLLFQAHDPLCAPEPSRRRSEAAG